MIGNFFGVPLAATHCSVGSLLGLSMAAKFNIVNRVYHSGRVKKENRINFKVMFKIFIWWVLTIPIVFATSAVVTYLVI